MEVTKRFYDLLEEFQNSGQPYIREELLSELIKVKTLINKLEILNVSEAESHSPTHLSQHSKKNAPHCMTELVRGCKEAQNTITMLYLFALNHVIDEMNVVKFLETYFNGIFKTRTFNLVSFKPQEKSKIAKVFCQIDKQFLSESAKETISKEIEEQFTTSHSEKWAKINLGNTTALKTFFEDVYKIEKGVQTETPIEEIYAIRFVFSDFEDCMILTDCPDNILLEKFLEYDLGLKFPNIFQVIKDTLDKVFFPEAFEISQDVILRPLEAIRMDYMDLARKVLLRHLQEDLVITFNAECTIHLPNAPPEERKLTQKDALQSKHRIDIKVLSPSSILIENNFKVDMHSYSQEISKIWARLNKKYSKIEQHEFENIKRHYETHNSQAFCLDFDSNFYLFYQNVPVPENLKKYVAAGNFLYIPSTRSHLIVLGPNFDFLTKITQTLNEAEKSTKPIVVSEHFINDQKFQLVIRRKDKNPTSKRIRNIQSFSIIFGSGQSLEDPNDEFLLEMPSLSLRNRSISTIRRSVKKLLTAKKLTLKTSEEDSDAKLNPQTVESLKETRISEYLPHESGGLERQVTPSRQWIRKFSAKYLKLSPDNMPSFLQLQSVSGFETNTKSKFQKKPSRQEDDFGEYVIFNAASLDVFEDDDKKLADWNFDVPKISNDLEKSRLVWYMMEDFGLITDFEIDRNILCEFILQIKSGYSQHKNPFHNYDHGVTVMHGCYYILKYCGFRDNFSSLMNLGILVAAFCHDVGHRGKTNIFEVNARSDVAITYHDRAVLEQYHAAYTFRVLSKEAYNILASLSPEDYKDIRKIIISCILATDMKEHFDELKNLKLLTEGLKQMAGSESPHRAKSYSKKKFPGAGGEKKPEDSNGDSGLEWSEDDIKVITGMIVHSSDLSGPTKSWELEYYFAVQVNKEFIKQSEEEKALGLPVTPYMLNLDKPSVMAKAEMQFIKFIIKPLWDTFNEFIGGSLDIACENLQNNMNKWEEMYNKALQEESNEPEKPKENEKEKESEKEPEKAPRRDQKKSTFIMNRQPTIQEEDDGTA